MSVGAGSTDLVTTIVNNLKSQGVFDHFRQECLSTINSVGWFESAECEVKEAASTFLSGQRWSPGLNKTQLREALRQHLMKEGYLDNRKMASCIEDVIRQKILPLLLPGVEKAVEQVMCVKPNPHSVLRRLLEQNPTTEWEKLIVVVNNEERKESYNLQCAELKKRESHQERKRRRRKKIRSRTPDLPNKVSTELPKKLADEQKTSNLGNGEQLADMKAIETVTKYDEKHRSVSIESYKGTKSKEGRRSKGRSSDGSYHRTDSSSSRGWRKSRDRQKSGESRTRHRSRSNHKSLGKERIRHRSRERSRGHSRKSHWSKERKTRSRSRGRSKEHSRKISNTRSKSKDRHESKEKHYYHSKKKSPRKEDRQKCDVKENKGSRSDKKHASKAENKSPKAEVVSDSSRVSPCSKNTKSYGGTVKRSQAKIDGQQDTCHREKASQYPDSILKESDDLVNGSLDTPTSPPPVTCSPFNSTVQENEFNFEQSSTGTRTSAIKDEGKPSNTPVSPFYDGDTPAFLNFLSNSFSPKLKSKETDFDKSFPVLDDTAPADSKAKALVANPDIKDKTILGEKIAYKSCHTNVLAKDTLDLNTGSYESPDYESNSRKICKNIVEDLKVTKKVIKKELVENTSPDVLPTDCLSERSEVLKKKQRAAPSRSRMRNTRRSSHDGSAALEDSTEKTDNNKRNAPQTDQEDERKKNQKDDQTLIKAKGSGRTVTRGSVQIGESKKSGGTKEKNKRISERIDQEKNDSLSINKMYAINQEGGTMSSEESLSSSKIRETKEKELHRPTSPKERRLSSRMRAKGKEVSHLMSPEERGSSSRLMGNEGNHLISPEERRSSSRIQDKEKEVSNSLSSEERRSSRTSDKGKEASSSLSSEERRSSRRTSDKGKEVSSSLSSEERCSSSRMRDMGKEVNNPIPPEERRSSSRTRDKEKEVNNPISPEERRSSSRMKDKEKESNNPISPEERRSSSRMRDKGKEVSNPISPEERRSSSRMRDKEKEVNNPISPEERRSSSRMRDKGKEVNNPISPEERRSSSRMKDKEKEMNNPISPGERRSSSRMRDKGKEVSNPISPEERRSISRTRDKGNKMSHLTSPEERRSSTRRRDTKEKEAVVSASQGERRSTRRKKEAVGKGQATPDCNLTPRHQNANQSIPDEVNNEDGVKNINPSRMKSSVNYDQYENSFSDESVVTVDECFNEDSDVSDGKDSNIILPDLCSFPLTKSSEDLHSAVNAELVASEKVDQQSSTFTKECQHLKLSDENEFKGWSPGQVTSSKKLFDGWELAFSKWAGNEDNESNNTDKVKEFQSGGSEDLLDSLMKQTMTDAAVEQETDEDSES